MTLDFSLAGRDLISGLRKFRLGIVLGLEDLRDRYRRSLIGILWITLSFLAFLSVKAMIFGRFNIDLGEAFVVYLAVGFAIWTFMSNVVNGSVNAYISSTGWIMTTNLPYTVYFTKIIVRSLIEFALTAMAALVFCLAMAKANPAGFVYVLPALALYLVSAYGICMLTAAAGARFRDLAYAIQTAMRVLFFATPIIWSPGEDPFLQTVALWNPFNHYIQIVREPFMSGAAPGLSWIVVIACSLGLALSGFLVFAATKRRVPVYL